MILGKFLLELEYIEAWNGYLCFNIFPVLFVPFSEKKMASVL